MKFKKHNTYQNKKLQNKKYSIFFLSQIEIPLSEKAQCIFFFKLKLDFYLIIIPIFTCKKANTQLLLKGINLLFLIEILIKLLEIVKIF